MKNIFKAVVVLFLFSGCAAILGGSTKTHFYTQTPHAKIYITPDGPHGDQYTWTNETVTSHRDSAGCDSATYKMKNFKSVYYIRQELEGYKPDVMPILPTRFNPGKILGYVLAGVTDIFFYQFLTTPPISDNIDETVLLPAVLLGIGGWSIFPIGPKHMYEKKYTLNKLQPIPKKKENEKDLFMDQAAVKIEENNYKWNYYDSYANYLKGVKMYGSSSSKKVTYENTDFTHDVNKLLIKYQYCDTTKKLLANTFNSMRLRTTITGYETTTAGSMYFIGLTTKWSLHDYYDKAEKASKEFTSNSKWISNSSPSEDEIHELISDALENGLIRFLGDSAIKNYLKGGMNTYNDMLAKWTTTTVKNTETASSIPEVSKAVVTIKTKEGHGSGCIISKEGLILTNYHVAGDSATKLQILFEDGTKDSGVVIRVNAFYDLALVKIKPVTVKPLKINLAKTIEVGTEVFAVGTPEDIDLGQTVTKGIISGKRKVDDKVYIQSDVSISPGNSGGAMITKDGLVVGVINAKIIGKGVEGIGFAIPAYYIEEGLKLKFE